MKKIPYGIVDFKTLIENDYYYVDKTMYLEKLENMPTSLFYLRPGRFGKSLFTSMMYYYYDINSKPLFEKLFKDLYVSKNPTNEKNSYYILKFDFSGIASAGKNEEELENEFVNKVISGIKLFNAKYKLNIEIKGNQANSIILNFLTDFKSLNLEHKIYIIIDEYDNFTNAILEGSATKFINIVGDNGFVKAFYSIIKENMGTIVKRFFATGICPITLDSMTTGFNIATDISTDVRFNSTIGLTHREVKDLIIKVVEEKDQEEIYNLMISNYDGYLFNEEASERVFNATLVMYLLNYYEAFQKIPKELMDKNIAFNSGKIGKLIELKNNNFYKELLKEIILNEKVNGILKQKFDLLVDFNKDDIISILYYFGYLTIATDEFGDYYFKIPNEIMKTLYGNYFLKKLEEINIGYDSTVLSEINEELKRGKIERIANYVSEILKKLDNRDFIKLEEKSLKYLFFAYLINNKNFKVRSEYPSNGGYIDIYLIKNNDLIQNNIMIELKYIKKKDYNEKLLKEKIEEGKAELIKYSKDERISNALKYLVVYVGNDLKVLDLV